MKITDLKAVERQVRFEGSPAQKAILLEILASAGALMRGHFVLLSGQHSSHFLRFRALGKNASHLQRIAGTLTGRMEEAGIVSDAILSPESAGYLLGDALSVVTGAQLAVARLDSQRRPTTELALGKMKPGARVVLVNDIVTSGSSMDTLCALVEASGGKVTGVVAFATASSKVFHRWCRARDVPGLFLFEALWDLWNPSNCEMCNANDPAIPAAELN
ncbi:MAG: hypothetical protein DYH12_07445 [Sorangiineae bacterium PRO1]|nr:hypothetical protein [Sorangiineae bacterium PRO1]